ncbi:MAG: 5-formyltetrahydrofolate cyclo-ligase [Candidatus Melainabacteria bacterium]
MDSLVKAKSQIRKEVLALRKELDWQRLSRLICGRLSQLELFRKAQCTLIYWPTATEVDVTTLMNVAEDGIQTQWYCPRITPMKAMAFHRLLSGQPMRENAFGIQEPLESAPVLAETVVPDGMILPGLAFDSAGNRLGYGQGYYDRFLANNPGLASMLRIGVCPEACLLETIPVDALDQPVDLVVTESRVIETHARNRS